MSFVSFRKGLAACLLGVAAMAPAVAQTVLGLPTAQEAGADLRQALTVPVGGSLRIERLPLGDQAADGVSVELRRTNTGATPPLLVVHSSNGVSVTRPPVRAHFTGQLVGDPQSSVFLSVDSQGSMRSIVRRGEDVFVGELLAPAASGEQGTARTTTSRPSSRRVDFYADAPNRPFSCGVTSEFIQKNYVAPSAALIDNLRRNRERASTPAAGTQTAQAVGPQRRADIIIETDYELLKLLGSTSAVYAYVTDLFGYVSSQYQSEVGARLNITQVNVYTSSASDPWSSTTSGDTLLGELQNYWNASGRIEQSRHHVHLLSGRNTGGGVAYLNTLGSAQKQYAYGVSGNIEGSFSPSNPKVVWDAVVIAHEIGHAFGSDHTHNYDNPYLGSSQGGAIDCCYSEDSGQCVVQLGGTYRYGVFPGSNSTFGGSPGVGAGTIMSYCDNLQPGMSNISFNFGTNHTRGVNPWRVANVLQSSAQTYLPLDTTQQNYALSVTNQGTGTGTVSSSPSGISCGSTCSASFAAGTAVTLTAQAATGSIFSGWGGACAGSSNTCSVNMDSARSVTANFAAEVTTRTVTLAKSGNGTGSVTSSPTGLSCAMDCNGASGNFSKTATINLTALASSGSTFAGWGGACSGTGSCTIAAGTSSASVTANFATSASTRLVTLTKEGSGSGSVTSTPTGLSCTVDCSSSSAHFASTTAVTLIAQASSGSTFTGWSGACSGTGSCTIAAGANSADVKANFSGGTSSYTQQVVTMFTGYFGRPAGASGLTYYENQLAQSGGNYRILVDDFYKSAESQGIYGGATVPSQITQVFQQLFSRQPQDSGLTYWTQQVNRGVISVPEIAYTVAYNAAAADTEALNAKRRAALAFTQALAANAQYANAYAQSLSVGRLYLGCVSGTATADAAIAKLPTTMINLAAGIKTYSCP